MSRRTGKGGSCEKNAGSEDESPKRIARRRGAVEAEVDVGVPEHPGPSSTDGGGGSDLVPARPPEAGWAGWWPLCVVGLLAVIAIWRWFASGVPGGGDWAQYMSHARALLEGRAYDDIGYLYSPEAWTVGPPRYPPGLPLTLVPLVAIFGDVAIFPRILMHVLLAVVLAAAYRYFADEGDRTLAWSAVLLLGTSFLLLDTANVVRSDLGFMAFVWLALVSADHGEPWRPRQAVTIALLGILALLHRVAAAPLVGAVLLWALLRRRPAGSAPWLVGGAWAATLALVLWAFGPGEQAAGSAAGAVAADPDGSLQGLRWSLTRVPSKLVRYRFALSEAYLYPFPGRTLNQVYHVLAAGLTVVGLWHWARGGWKRFGVCFAVMTGAMLMLIPVWVQRYAWVLVPFACYGLVRGAALAAGRVPGRSAAFPARAAATLVAVVVTLAVADEMRRPGPRLEYAESDWRAMGAALRISGSSQIRVASNRPRVLTWYTRLPAAALPNRDLDVFLAEVERLDLTHVVITGHTIDDRLRDHWDDWTRERPDLFRRVAEIGVLTAYVIERGGE